ncbi:hypothetical protein D3C71_1902600 [compost metagenome]
MAANNKICTCINVTVRKFFLIFIWIIIAFYTPMGDNNDKIGGCFSFLNRFNRHFVIVGFGNARMVRRSFPRSFWYDSAEAKHSDFQAIFFHDDRLIGFGIVFASSHPFNAH